jgi:hypothetical protein
LSEISFFIKQKGRNILIPNHRWQSRLHFRVLALVGLTASLFVASAQAEEAKPNSIFITGEDIGWIQLGTFDRSLMVGEMPKSSVCL